MGFGEAVGNNQGCCVLRDAPAYAPGVSSRGPRNGNQNSTRGRGKFSPTRSNVNTAIGIIKFSPWGQGDPEAAAILNRLNEINNSGRISPGGTQKKDAFAEFRVGRSPNLDSIVLNQGNILSLQYPELRLPGFLVHEGTHAVGRDVNPTLQNERKAFQNQYNFENSLNFPFARMRSDDEIKDYFGFP